jgi:ATP synthase protein I
MVPAALRSGSVRSRERSGVPMNPRKPSPSLENLKSRLKEARGARQEAEPTPYRPGPLGQAFRLMTEMVAALFVGGVIGWALDRWLGTRPWLLLVFLTLGIAAGFLNAYRTWRSFGGTGAGGGA